MHVMLVLVGMIMVDVLTGGGLLVCSARIHSTRRFAFIVIMIVVVVVGMGMGLVVMGMGMGLAVMAVHRRLPSSGDPGE